MKTLNRKLLKQVLIGVLIVGVLFLIFTKRNEGFVAPPPPSTGKYLDIFFPITTSKHPVTADDLLIAYYGNEYVNWKSSNTGKTAKDFLATKTTIPKITDVEVWYLDVDEKTYNKKLLPSYTVKSKASRNASTTTVNQIPNDSTTKFKITIGDTTNSTDLTRTSLVQGISLNDERILKGGIRFNNVDSAWFSDDNGGNQLSGKSFTVNGVPKVYKDFKSTDTNSAETGTQFTVRILMN